MKRDKFGKYENSRCIRSSRYEIIIAFISLDGTWQVNRWMIEQDKVVLKEACINYRARFWCTRDDRLVDTLGTHFLPCAASRTFVPRILPTPLGYWACDIFLPRIIEFQRRDEGSLLHGETRPTLNVTVNERSIGKLSKG